MQLVSLARVYSTAFVAEARQIVAEETNAKITGKASLDVVLFAYVVFLFVCVPAHNYTWARTLTHMLFWFHRGNGATSAVELLIDCLSLKQLAASLDRQQRPVVFIGPYEHHSNLIPWRETGCEIVMIPECSQTHTVDLDFLDRVLQHPDYNNHQRMKVGTFTAASNVTGKLCDVDAIAATLHRHNALAFFDYATASAYAKIDMNPATAASSLPTEQDLSLMAKDAVFLSPHKMLGGVGTPGVLIVKKHLVNQVNAPSRSGGGTVFYVTHTHHRFLSNRIERYEGGTPNVAGIMRVGLTFLLKRQTEAKYRRLVEHNATDERHLPLPPTLLEYECSTYARVSEYLKEHAPNLVLLGADDGGQNLPIFSFLIRCGSRFLHYNYVCAILNDMFGIQSRGGCQCAGPYSQRLLGLVKTKPSGDVPNPNEEIENALYRYKERAELLRPGYTRLSLPFKGLRSVESDYVVKALIWVAKNGWALMCQYRCNHRTGEWRHFSRQGKPLGRDEKRWLSHYSIDGENPVNARQSHSTTYPSTLVDAIINADKLFAAAKADRRSIVEAVKMADVDSGVLTSQDGELEKLRWYVIPKECATMLSSGNIEPNDKIVEGALNPRTAMLPDAIDVCEPNRKRKPSLDASDPRTRLCFGGSEVSNVTQVSKTAIDNVANQAEIVSDCTASDTGDLSLTENVNTVLKTCVGRFDFLLNGDAEKASKKSSRTSETWGLCTDTRNLRVSANATDESNLSHPTVPPNTASSTKRFKHVQPPPKLMRTVTQAVVQWDMIQDGDRLLLGLSGGKDSLSLLHCLLELKRKLPISFEIEVCTIDPMTPSFDPSPLVPYVEGLGLKYHYIRDDIVARASSAGKSRNMVSSLCAFCARMKRGNLYSCARTNQCNKLVLAQHLDDCAESMMMSMMHNGFLRTMKANYFIDAGDIAVVRPMIYCRESLMTDFAKAKSLPVINENCPACFEEPKERARVKKLLCREESLYPNFFDNIRRSLIPLMHDDMTAIFRSYTEEVVSRSRKVPYKQRMKSNDGGNEEVGLVGATASASSSKSLADFSEGELAHELARRKAARYKSSVSIQDPTGQVCSLNGGNGSIPCQELME
jgi:selenocysteine lyase/cysteine desulfurase/tRNA(Ile)-lysidine synthase TilS/MesJ